MDKKEIAIKLQSIMAAKNLSPMQFSDLTGISRSTIEGYIKAKSLLKIDNFASICEKLQISSDDFLGLKAEPLSLAEDETELLHIYRGLDREGRTEVMHTCYHERRRMQDAPQQNHNPKIG